MECSLSNCIKQAQFPLTVRVNDLTEKLSKLLVSNLPSKLITVTVPIS